MSIDLNYKYFDIASTGPGFFVFITCSTIGPYAFIVSIVHNSHDKFVRICKDTHTAVPDIPGAVVIWNGTLNVNSISAYYNNNTLPPYKVGTVNIPFSHLPTNILNIYCNEIVIDYKKFVSNTILPIAVVSIKPTGQQQTCSTITIVNNLVYQGLYPYSSKGLYGIYNIITPTNTPLLTKYDNIGGLRSLVAGTVRFSWDHTIISSSCSFQCTNIICNNQLTIALTNNTGDYYLSPRIISNMFTPTVTPAIIQAGSFTVQLSLNQVFYIFYSLADVGTNYPTCLSTGLNFMVTLNS